MPLPHWGCLILNDIHLKLLCQHSNALADSTAASYMTVYRYFWGTYKVCKMCLRNPTAKFSCLYSETFSVWGCLKCALACLYYCVGYYICECVFVCVSVCVHFFSFLFLRVSMCVCVLVLVFVIVFWALKNNKDNRFWLSNNNCIWSIVIVPKFAILFSTFIQLFKLYVSNRLQIFFVIY
jgi:hypothetical protein